MRMMMEFVHVEHESNEQLPGPYCGPGTGVRIGIYGDEWEQIPLVSVGGE